MTLAACERHHAAPTAPGTYELSGPVILTGYHVAADGTFLGTRVIADADGVPVELVAGTRIVARTLTSGGRYRFVGVGPGGYIVRSTVFDYIGDATDALTIIDHDVASRDTLRLESFGDMAPVPNPMGADVVVFFTLPDSAQVVMRVFDLAGDSVRTIINGVRPKGVNTTVWDGRYPDGSPAPGGMYWLTFAAADDRRLQLLFR